MPFDRHSKENRNKACAAILAAAIWQGKTQSFFSDSSFMLATAYSVLSPYIMPPRNDDEHRTAVTSHLYAASHTLGVMIGTMWKAYTGDADATPSTSDSAPRNS
jgi:hypothetical protein